MHCADLELQISPIDLYSAIAEHNNTVFLLESAEGNEKLARFSFIGFSPDRRIALKNNLLKIGEQEYDTAEPLQQLKKEVLNTKQKQAGFIGGAVGYFSFEFFKYIENIPLESKDTLNFPDFEFGIFNDAIVYDHKQNSISYIYGKENRIAEIKNFVKDASFDAKNFQIYNKKCNFTKEKFCENVDIAKEHIKNGDIFQAVISKRYELKFDGSLIPFYKKLKALNPSPYMYYLKFDEREIIGSSPENLVRIENNDITSYATLAGTRSRGRTIEEDVLLEKELLNDEKERAEHLMLVDLTRNDIGKVAKAGTVKVSKLMEVHKYSDVQHISSAINAKLAENKDAFDAFKAIFPAGTVSGAPKIRAIEIIDELEKVARGPYGGAIGYFSSNGNADFAIGIRTLFAEKRKAYIQTGAGIVYDSVPETEFYETEKKAKALLDAIGDEKYELAINR
ncbi:MAG: anthranilate synthase component I family protein [archaeon]